MKTTQKPFYKQRISLLLGILLLLVLIANWEGGNTPIPGLTGPDTAQSAPNYYLTEVTTRQFTQEGLLDYEMRATRVAHLPPNEVTQIDNPLLTYFSDTGAWHAQAKKGLLALGGDQVSLENNVLLYENERELKIKTEFLMLRPSDQIAMTGAVVEISSPEGETTGVGMHVNLDDGYIKLLSKVRGTYTRL